MISVYTDLYTIIDERIMILSIEKKTMTIYTEVIISIRDYAKKFVNLVGLDPYPYLCLYSFAFCVSLFCIP